MTITRPKFAEMPKDYPGLVTDAVGRAARIVVERFGKEYDDAACIVLRYQPC